MGNQLLPSADKISAEDFAAYLAKYEDCIVAISASRASKPGDKTLAELDKYRYGDAIANFSGDKPRKQMELDDVKTLVNWKLRYGKFRPTLMKLVSSNEPDFVTQTVKEASESYRGKADVGAALGILTKLKGIGPATASLLLSVLHPERVIFFADEAFYWLCCSGQKESIKYNAKEYQTLSDRAGELCKRLKIKAVDVERVAFVIMRQQDGDLPTEKVTKRGRVSPPPKATDKQTNKKQLRAKRKATSDEEEPEATRPIHQLAAFPDIDAYIMLLSPPLSPCESNMDSQPGAATKFNMEAFSQREPILLQPRFAEIKNKIVSGNADAIAASWTRLLRELKREINLISTLSATEIIPSIDFEDICKSSSGGYREEFSTKLRHRGVAIIRGVIPKDTALALKQDVDEYLSANSQTSGSGYDQHQIYELFWSPAQVQARAHPNILAAQKFAMSHWCTASPRSPSSTSVPVPVVAASTPVTYADRLIIPMHDPWTQHATVACSTAQIDNGSVERWEADGYGRARTYSYIFEGWWEGHDPWDASARVLASPDLYGGAGRCSAFRMFQGWLSLGGLAVVPLVKHAAAYFLLRPFFSPRTAIYNETLTATAKWEAFLSETNWTLIPPEKQDSILHGALPSYLQEINNLLHPHLRLGESLVSIPTLEPGDYLIWHPDLIHADVPGDGATMICLPACPLTQSNALYVAQQRKAFLLGNPAPDFTGGGSSQGESYHIGRPGVQDVSEAGGEDGLRAMGLYP
ncbi:hypothetical protein CONLIGDRAFT_656656 [Coniochaeta ligniaria NRRL 30616]|uniref:DUF1479-domain-containing protein n=1 Tax=Coniochaeta ligniaria NRRL 30616 TaxID=1408157 RepID=A0A1J7J8I3_9PEZI|nr:hypothetical protein CONLIGDRAFT_656656 [Coniochaeta ligniaria NRRL 30616]